MVAQISRVDPIAASHASVMMGQMRWRRAMRPSSIEKRSVAIAGRKTSVSLETEFWDEVREISAQRGVTLNRLVGKIDAERKLGHNLSSAIRLFVLDHLKGRVMGTAGEHGPHIAAGSPPTAPP
jgi:predicted DNA-binding ribbon-helix-helix protein